MLTAPARLDEWDESDLAALLTLEAVAPLRYRNRYGDPNENGRSYGGQLLAQALMAASASVPDDRPVTAMQFLFLQGAVHDVPLDLQVTKLQDGKRFSSRHVRGVQPGERTVLDAHVTYAAASPSPSHAAPTTALEQPHTLQCLGEMPSKWSAALGAIGPYSMAERKCLDFRLADSENTLASLNQPRARYWIRTRLESSSSRLHEGAFAYLCDWWLNFSSIGSHALELRAEGRRVYMASLNHNIWFHRPFRADGWLHFDTESASAGGGRGLSIARIHDEQGVLVATASQECLMAYADT